MKLFNLLLLSMTIHASCLAQGVDHGNGGNEEIQFASITSEVVTWVQKNLNQGTLEQKLHLPMTGGHFLALLFDATQTAKVKFTDAPVMVGSLTRICKNIPSENIIICNRDEWRKTPGDIKYAIALHEHLGLKSLESNVGEYSQYPISKYILPFVYAVQKYELGMNAKAEAMIRAPSYSMLKDRFANVLRSPKLDLNLDIGSISLDTGKQIEASYACVFRSEDNPTTLYVNSFKRLGDHYMIGQEFLTTREINIAHRLACDESSRTEIEAQACYKKVALPNENPASERMTYHERIAKYERMYTRHSTNKMLNFVIALEHPENLDVMVARESGDTLLLHTIYHKTSSYGICKKFE